MNNKVKVAYIVTVYNVNNYLKECLESIKKITSRKEVIIIDDCGSQNPLPIIKSFLKDASFKYIKNKINLGIGPTRNIGVNAVSDDVSHIYFVDGDDIIDSKKIDSNFQQLEVGKTYLVTKYIRFTKTTSEVANIRSFSLSEFPLVVWGTFWAADIAKQIPFKLRAYEDGPWVAEYISKISNAESIMPLQDYTYFYRKRFSSIVNSKKDLQTAIDRLNSFKFVYESKIFGWNATKVEEVMFQYLSLSRKERRSVSIDTFNIKLIQKIWFSFAFYMQKLIKLDKILWKKYRKDFFE